MESITEEQNARAFLRERLLRLVSNLQGKDCEVQTHGNSSLKCKIRSFEPTMEHVMVDNLVTPCQEKIDKAILRTQDIRSMHLNLDDSFFTNDLV